MSSLQPLSSGAPTTTAAAPLRATVILIRDDTNEPKQTMRVPITEQTTVLQLAKEALLRYQQQQQIPNSKQIGVTKVFVEHDNAELFIRDTVTSVVTIATEKVCLLLREKTASAPVASKQAATATAAVAPPQAPSTVPVPLPPPTPSSPPSAKHMASVATSPPSAFKHVSKSQPMPAQVAVASPPNAVHSSSSSSRRTPVTLPRAIESREDSPPLSRRRIETKEGGTPEAARVEDVDRMSPTTRRAFLKQKQQDGWGVDAHKSFASNYVSDPEKLAREIRKQNRSAKQQLGFSKDCAMDCDQSQPSQKPSSAATTSHHETAVREVPAARALFAEPIAPAKPGWGPMATKFFDPNTYMDDPSKAKLSSISSNDGPIRARRSF